MFRKDNMYAMGKRDAIKFICAIIAIMLFINQVNVGYKFMEVEDDMGRTLTESDYRGLKLNEEINGEITKIITQFEGAGTTNDTLVNYYLVAYNNDTLVVFLVRANSELDRSMQGIINHNISSVKYRGVVHEMTQLTRDSIGLLSIMQNLLKANDIKGSVGECLQDISISAVEQTAVIDDRVITATFVGGIIMFVIACLLMYKPLVKFYLINKVRKGEISTITMTKEDINTDEIDKYFDENSYSETKGETDYYSGYDEESEYPKFNPNVERESYYSDEGIVNESFYVNNENHHKNNESIRRNVNIKSDHYYHDEGTVGDTFYVNNKNYNGEDDDKK